MYNELIDALWICGHASGCPEFCPRYRTYEDGLTCAQHVIFDAADAIERLMAEVDRKDKVIQGLLDAVDRKNADIKKWKAAWKTAYKCYESAQREIDEMRGIESAEQKGDELNEP